MADDNKQWNVSMRDGRLIDARVATADLAVLRTMSKDNDELLETLYAQAQDGAQPDSDLAKDLNEVFFVGGKLRPLAGQMLKNAIEMTENGEYRIVDPFETNQVNRVVLDNLKKNNTTFLEKLAREIHQNDGDDLIR